MVRARRSCALVTVLLLFAACGSDRADNAATATESTSSSTDTSTTPPDPAGCEALVVVPRKTAALLPKADGVVTDPDPPFDPGAELMNAISAAVPCQYSGVSYDPNSKTFLAWAAPLDDTALAAINAFAAAHPDVAIKPRAGAQPEVVGELQRSRVNPVLIEHHVGGGIGVDEDGRINVMSSAPTPDEVAQLEADIRAAVAMKSPLEQQLPAADPVLDITVGGPRFTPA